LKHHRQAQTMTAAQENYSLRWNNHQSHILESFEALLQQKSLVDVTLVCSDRSLRAHKVVLSACSPFFERVFNDTPCKHPVIVLKDFRGWLVQAIVDFMYRGEISVPQEKLNQLIQAGESLQIRGLIGAVPYTIPIESDVESPRETCVSPMPRRKQARPRRRSGELTDIPQDLSNGTIITKCEQDDPPTDTDDDDVELHEIAKRVRQNGVNDDSKSHNDDNNNGLDDDDDEAQENEEKENQPGDHSTDVPENLCMKKPAEGSQSSESLVGDKNNNNDGNGGKKRSTGQSQNDFHERFILSLKDLRHLRGRQGPPGHPFSDILSHLPISPPPSFHIGHQESKDNQNMKMDSDHSDAETPPFSDQMDLAQHRNHLNSNLEKLTREHHKHHQQMMNHQNSGMPPFPPQFHQGDGQMRAPGHHGHPSSPLSFPSMPSVSALTLTPPHSKFNLSKI
jgi:BTB/POZ domain